MACAACAAAQLTHGSADAETVQHLDDLQDVGPQNLGPPARMKALPWRMRQKESLGCPASYSVRASSSFAPPSCQSLQPPPCSVCTDIEAETWTTSPSSRLGSSYMHQGPVHARK